MCSTDEDLVYRTLYVPCMDTRVGTWGLSFPAMSRLITTNPYQGACDIFSPPLYCKALVILAKTKPALGEIHTHSDDIRALALGE